MNGKFINDLRSCPYYERIFKGHNVIMLYLSGSRLIDVTDERSDYDLVALTSDGERIEHPNEFLTYKGVKVHCSYIPITKFVSNADGSLMSCFGLTLFSNLQNDMILYENPSYQSVINYLKNNKNAVSLVGMYGLAKFHRKLINDVVSAGEIEEKHRCKFLYHLCYASYLLLCETVNKTLLSKIKRIRWQEVEEEYKAAAVERIRLFSEFVAARPVDVGGIVESFDRDITQLLAR